MSSTYTPLPFSYLAPGSQAPKATGFRKDEGLYGNRPDRVKPIPALRHDQPRRAADWSFGQMLHGSELTPSPADRRRPTAHDFGETESAIHASYSNVRLPRPDVSLYQSQIVGPSSGPLAADTPSGHYLNRSPMDVGEAERVDDELPTSSRPHGGGGSGMFDNFILRGPGAQTSDTTEGRRIEDERPLQRSRLEQLFNDDPSTSDVAALRRVGSDRSESRIPRVSANSGGDASEELPRTDLVRSNSSRIIVSRANSFGNGDAKLTQWSSATDDTSTSGCCGCNKAVHCSRCRLCILIAIAVFIALLMLAAGFVAGWFAGELHRQRSPVLAPADDLNVTATTWPSQNDSVRTTQGQRTTVTATRTSSTTAVAQSVSTSQSASSLTVPQSSSTVKNTTTASTVAVTSSTTPVNSGSTANTTVST